MTEEEFNKAAEFIQKKTSIHKACGLILVNGFYNVIACKTEGVSRPTVNKYIKLIKEQWRINTAKS